MHIAIIPDGNRRWAKQRGLPAFAGHKKGAEAIQKILEAALKLNVSHLSLWGASINNITKRTDTEIQFLYKLFTRYFKKLTKAKAIHQRRVRIRAIGRWPDYFSQECQKAINGMLEATKTYSERHLTFLLAYNGTEEMTSAIQNIVTGAVTNGASPLPGSQPITAAAIKQHLYTKDLPPVDLVIRTGGDPHLSTGFMMWDVADAQLYFTDKMLPEFSVEDFHQALKTYEQTERRLGK